MGSIVAPAFGPPIGIKSNDRISHKAGHNVTKPFDGNAATVGNGVMVALVMESQGKVDALHKKAMELGATDEGAPGPRGPGFYAGYFRDPDGNKLNAFFMG